MRMTIKKKGRGMIARIVVPDGWYCLKDDTVIRRGDRWAFWLKALPKQGMPAVREWAPTIHRKGNLMIPAKAAGFYIRKGTA